ncbi:MAG: YihY/virulence factor BrkB family protein [Rubricoccaceae bacterium]|nr:YihY/virulence factor BrkB family protein [Rubricoccaceae bacterium]
MSPKTVWSLVRETLAEIGEDDVTSFSAAIAYYTIFSLPPLLVILVGVAGVVFGPEQVQEAITGQVRGLAGEGAGGEIQTMIENAGNLGEGVGGKLLGVLFLFLGATGAFGQLQKALNRAWDVRVADGGGLQRVLLKRLLSFGMVLTIAFLLLVSLVLSAVIAALSNQVSGVLPGGLSSAVWQLINLAVSFGIITLLFAAIFVVLPDAKIAWRDVWVGAAATAALFTLGKWLIGVYLGRSDPGSAFGAAGSLALILVWIYYSALILLAGAEFTQVWARRFGKRLVPEAGAVRDGELDELHPYARERDPDPY